MSTSDATVCAGCNQPFGNGIRIWQAGRAWHQECLYPSNIDSFRGLNACCFKEQCWATADERDRLRAAVEALAAIVQRDRVRLAQNQDRAPTRIAAEYNKLIAEYDAVLRLADAAMGNDVERAG